MNVRAVTAIKTLQPHVGQDIRLALLRDLSNWDKHRLLQTTIFSTKVVGVGVYNDIPGVVLPMPAAIMRGRLYDGAVFYRFQLPYHPDGRPPKVDVQGHVESDVIFKKGTAAENRPALQLLFDIADFIELDVWLALESFLPPPPSP
jgi:hypothetical protein